MPVNFSDLIFWIAIFSIFLTFYLFILALGYRKETLEQRLNRFTALRPPQESSTKKRPFKDFLSLLGGFTPVRWRKKLDRELLQGDIPLKGGEFLALQAFLALVFYFLGLMMTRSLGMSFILLILGMLIPRIYLLQAKKKKRKQFDNQLADSLLIIANSLRSGFSLLQAMEMVSQEMPNPISGEFKLTLREMTYGTSTETALMHLAERVGSDDLELLVTAILIQRQVGGNLAEVLMNIHATIEDRLRIQLQIKTLTAQGRMSGTIIGILPFGLMVAFSILNPSYLKPLFSTPLGLTMLGTGIVAQFIGFLIIRKIISVEA